jgi:hypothetical protein
MKHVILVLSLGCVALGQTLPPEYRAQIQKLKSKVEDDRNTAAATLKDKVQLINLLSHLQQEADSEIVRNGLAQRALASEFSSRQRNRQMGESAAGGGSTSLTSLAGFADTISAAFESGQLSRASEGTVTTFRASGLSVYSLLSGYQRPCPISNPLCDTSQEITLRGLSGSLSIDTAKKPDTATSKAEGNGGVNPVVALTNGGGRVSSATFRYQLLRRTPPSDFDEEERLGEWKESLKATKPSAADLTKAIQDITDKINGRQGPFQAWQNNVDKLIDDEKLSSSEFETKYLQLAKNYLDDNSPEEAKLIAFRAKRQGYYGSLEKALGEILFKPLLTVEYVYAAPTGLQTSSGLRFIADKKLLKRNVHGAFVDSDITLTANAAVNWYNTIPTGLNVGRMRDFQASAQLERALGSASNKVRSSVSLDAFYQYQVANSIITFGKNSFAPGTGIPLTGTAAEVLDTKGHIAIVQGKFTWRLTKSMSIPLAVSWANRTELVKASAVRGQVGISWSFDDLFSDK